jgi:hypothetical protein
MSVRAVAAKYKELVSQGKHFEFMRGFYSADMVSVEADGREFVGKEPVIKKSEVFQANHTFHSQDLRGPFFFGDANGPSGKFAVYLAIEFSPKAGGARKKLEEVGIYSVKNDIVTREEFFYDGAFL